MSTVKIGPVSNDNRLDGVKVGSNPVEPHQTNINHEKLSVG